MTESPPNPLKRKRNQWKAAENDAFYDGVARYSPNQPEEIARLVGTRTAVEVAEKIALLETGLEEAKTLGLLGNTQAHPVTHPELYAKRRAENVVQREERDSKAIADYEDEKIRKGEKLVTKKERKRWKKISALLNLKLLMVLTAKVYVQQDEAAIQRQTLVELHSLVSDFVKRLLTMAILRSRSRKKDKEYLNITEQDVRSAIDVTSYPNKENDYHMSHLLWTSAGRRSFLEHYGVDLDAMAVDSLHIDRGEIETDVKMREEEDRPTQNTKLRRWDEVPGGRVLMEEEERAGLLSAEFVLDDEDDEEEESGTDDEDAVEVSANRAKTSESEPEDSEHEDSDEEDAGRRSGSAASSEEAVGTDDSD